MDETPTLHSGSCLCGGIRYRVTGRLPDFEVCHCRQCQKAQGGACVVVAALSTSNFELLSGTDLLTSYRATPGKERLFCARCGSPLFSRRDDIPGALRLRVGTLEDVSGAGVSSHAYVASKVDWFEMPDDATPRHDGPRPG